MGSDSIESMAGCKVLPKMMRKVLSDYYFTAEMVLSQPFMEYNIIKDSFPLILPFDIDETTDLGGTLKIKMHMLLGMGVSISIKCFQELYCIHLFYHSYNKINLYNASCMYIYVSLWIK